VEPVFRILLVEDFVPFRRFVRSSLLQRPDLKIVGEASGGVEAVRKAKDLQPDIVLLDIGLPDLSGIYAAQQIRFVSPDSKLLFVTLETTSAVIGEAFRAGARGYVHKLRADSDLIPAIDALLSGRQFVSIDLEYRTHARAARRHDVQFYLNKSALPETVASSLASALRAERSAIVVATNPHLDGLIQRLKAEALDIDDAIQRGTFVTIDVDDMLSKIMVHGMPDYSRLFDAMGALIEAGLKSSNGRRNVVVGECAPTLWDRGNRDAAIQLEHLVNDVLKEIDADVICAYPRSAFQEPADRTSFEAICAAHTHVFSE